MKKMIFVAVLLTITQQAQASAVIVASAAATTAATAAAANSANIANQQAQRAANASASALPISVKGSKQHLGFITCGKRSYEAVGSLGCTVYGD
ncbi:hypothetical protein N7717_005035, partial [Escherichia coli]|nr:hypothetical protein [Escherichia coli]